MTGLGKVLLLLVAAASAPAQKFYTYVGDVSADTAIIAWGTTEGSGNTIGRDSKSHGNAVVTLGGREIRSERNWIQVRGLAPDREYPYEVVIRGRKIGSGAFRTHPLKADRLAFFVLGDYGYGGGSQRRIAQVMAREFEQRKGSINPVRFAITTGDNIYADLFLGFIQSNTGDRDRHWASKFFEPYEPLLRGIPFYPSLGNHDGNDSESRADLDVYLDNFFFPGGERARYYRFSFGGLADFFALDSTRNTGSGRPAPAYAAGGEQFAWLKKALGESRAPWKIVYFHHPPFTAGPNHGPSLGELRHFVDLFGRSGVSVVFNGHEHNFQYSERNEATGGVQYVVSGAGGQLRSGNIAANLKRAHIAGWAPERHFLLVEIDGRSMAISPLGERPIRVEDSSGGEVPTPLRISLK